VPASPPKNLGDLDVSSIETINNHTEINNSKNLGLFKINSSDLIEHRNSSLNEFSTETRQNSDSQKENLNVNKADSKKNKNLKISSCLDKWYKELKGNVLVSRVCFWFL
jgi:hypothetical protein